MADEGLTSAAEPLNPKYKVVIKYTTEVEGLAVYSETYDVEKLRKDIKEDEQKVRESRFRRIKCVVKCPESSRLFCLCNTVFAKKLRVL